MPLSAKLRKVIAREMATGKYSSPEKLMLEALDALADRRSAIAGIARGLEDTKTGRTRTWHAAKRNLHKRHPSLAEK
jgi:predicted transcriptional regulator